MAKLLRLRRGTDTQHSSFTGAEGEVTVNTTNDSLHVHDGTTAGGRELARADLSNVPAGTIDNADISSSAAIANSKLETSGVTAGTYGSSSAIPAITVNDRGIVTSATTSAIDSTAITNGTSNVSVAASGDITADRAGTTRLTVNGSGIDVNGNIVVSGTVDGRDLATDGSKLDGIAAGAEVNVNADWNASSGDAQILNKPTIPAAANNGTIQINQGGSSKGSFTVNQSNNTTINLDGGAGTTGPAAKHVIFNDTSILSSSGISSITKVTAGLFTVNFNGNMSSSNYLVLSTGRNHGTDYNMRDVTIYGLYSTSQCRVMIASNNNSGPNDCGAHMSFYNT